MMQGGDGLSTYAASSKLQIERRTVPGETEAQAVSELQQIVDVLGSVMHEMLAGKRTPEDAVKESQQEIDRIMRKAGYY